MEGAPLSQSYFVLLLFSPSVKINTNMPLAHICYTGVRSVVVAGFSSKTLTDQLHLQMSALKTHPPLAQNVFTRITECMKVHSSAPTEMLFLCVK